jgi:outer membrane immunogenic protein
MKSRITIFAAVFASSALSAVVFAGPETIPTDSKEVQQVTQPVSSECDWRGFYVGADAGGQFGHSEDRTPDFGYNADDQPWGYHEGGFAGAGQLGFNWQWRWLVLGPEIEVGYMNVDGDGVQPGSPGRDTRGESDSDVFTTLRGRVGFAEDCWLIYATGGAIGLNYDTGVVDDCDIAPCGGSLVNAHKRDFQWGYTVGGGLERMFGRHWSLKVEYLYFDLDHQGFSGVTNLGVRYQWSGDTTGHIVRGGLNFHF